MRFKYLYQQMLSHLTIILVAFLAIGIVMSQFVENLVFQNKSEELISYGENILEDLGFNLLENQRILSQYQNILADRDIVFSIFDAEGNVQFPISDSSVKLLFTESEWNRIKNGKRIIINVDIQRFDQAVSLVVIPFIRGDYFLGGILLTSPVSGTREMVHQFNRYMVLTGLIVVLVSGILSVISSNILVRRIKQLQKATSSIAKGEYNVVVPESDFDEIGQLAGNFRKMAEKLQESFEEVERSEKRRRQFMADVSHEMRTPLTTISGIVEGLKNDMIPEEEKEKALELVNKEAKRLIRLVNENLDYEKIRSNQVTLNKEVIHLAEALEIIEEQLQILAAEKGNTIIIDVSGDPLIYADYDRLIQILLNITKNSIQFTENGTITLRGKQEENVTIIEIEDTGIGMDPDEIENIWERFYRADLSRRTNPFGEFGLGLSIVKQLVSLHKGKIFVESEKGRGTKFIIHLPFPQEQQEKE